ncbi:MAG TPA: ParB/RepB/Spo0J family partition protein [Sedimentisphaerales bacterium]|nr:ParB/RepB/Spo0J family partition protein [Sedimentisphaerales bacterium]
MSQKMSNNIKSITLDKLVAHPDNPNRQSKTTFAKLLRNIKHTGLYEPILVRPDAKSAGCFQIINGHHRYMALSQLGYKSADCIVWDIDDQQTDILLATVNRLCGSDQLHKKLALLRRLNGKRKVEELGKLLPQTVKQIQRLMSMKTPTSGAQINTKPLMNVLVFLADDAARQIIEEAISLACEEKQKKPRAAKRSAALVKLARFYIENRCRSAKQATNHLSTNPEDTCK